MSHPLNRGRRRFCGVAAMTLAAGQLTTSLAQAQGEGAEVSKPPPNTPGGAAGTLPPLKQVNAGVLNVGYIEAGPADGKPLLLLHGWPYDIYSYVDVIPAVAAAGYRVIAPFVRRHHSQWSDLPTC